MLQVLFWESLEISSRPVQWIGYLSTQNRRSICLPVVFSRKKNAGWLRKCLKIEGHCKCDSIKVCNTPRSKKEIPKLYDFFVDFPRTF